MVLVDERLLDNLWKKQDLAWKRPVDYKLKTTLNSKLKTNLDDGSIPNDIKVKEYQNNLNRFLHTSRKQFEEPASIIEELKPVPALDIKKKKKKPKKTPVLAISPRRKRIVKKPKKYDWIKF